MYLLFCVFFSFLTVFLILVGVSLAVEGRRQSRRLEFLLPGSEEPLLEAAFGPSSRGRESLLLGSLRPLTEPLEKRISAQKRRQMRLKLLRAGMLDRLGEVEFIALSIITTVTGLCLAWLCYLRLAPTNPGNASILSLLIVIIAAILPDYWLQAQVNERQARIRKALPDAIDLLAVSVEAGSGFDGAMSQIESKFPGPLAQEINHVLEEMRLGRSRAEALRGMAERAGVPELTAFVSSICQADQMGVSIAGILRIQADSAREKRVQQVKEAAQKLPVKMLFPLVFFIFPSIFVVILGPAMIRILEAFSGVSAGR